MQNEITRRGAVVGVSAIGVASCTTTAGPAAPADKALSPEKTSGNPGIDTLRLNAEDLVYYAMIGMTISEIVRKQMNKAGRNPSRRVNVGFVKSSAPPAATTEDAAVGCCFVPVSVSDGEPLDAAARDPQKAYEQLLASIGVTGGFKPFGCVKCFN